MASRFILTGFIILMIQARLFPAALLINEFTTNTPDDWVELTLTGSDREKMDISGLYVTMYYGANEKLGAEPITIYSYDRPETPYDDRFVVVHLTGTEIPDETDRTGDTNRNGFIDVYCNNYYASLWNTEGVVAVDTDDDPANGGIIDFVYYSNRDGNANSVMQSYVAAAQSNRQWPEYAGANAQECGVFIGEKGMEANMSAVRISTADTNSAADFQLSTVPTPGRPNITLPVILNKRLFKTLRKKITVFPLPGIPGNGEIPLLVFHPCFLKYRIFSMTGIMIFESPLLPAVQPGLTRLYWNPLYHRSKYPTGLYLCKIEAVSTALRRSDEELVYILMSRYR